MNQEEIKNAIEKLKEVTESLSKLIVEEKDISFTDLRKLLASKSTEGFKDEVLALIKKYGANKLSDVKPDDYKKLYKEAEVLKSE